MKSKPIETEQEYEVVLAQIERLLDVAEPGTPQGTELELLVRLVHDYEGRVDPAPKPNLVQEVADMMRRGLKIVTELQEAEGGAWSGVELRERFGLGLADLRRRRMEEKIIYWQGAQRRIFYPKWQFTDAGALLPGVQEILTMFRSRDEWRIMRYFLGERLNLGGRRPLDLLRAGNIEAVLNHARSHAEHDTW